MAGSRCGPRAAPGPEAARTRGAVSQRRNCSRSARPENGTPVLIVAALLATVPAIRFWPLRPRRAAASPGATERFEHGPPPSPLVAPRPPADTARSSAAAPARETAREAEDAGPAPTGASPASPDHAAELV